MPLINIAFDISLLGISRAAPFGIYRVVEAFAEGLSRHPDVNLMPYASAALGPGVRRTIQANPALAQLETACLTQGSLLNILIGTAESPLRINARFTAGWIESLYKSVPCPESADVVHSGFYPLPQSVYRQNISRLLTIHDIIPVTHPHYVHPVARRLFLKTFRCLSRDIQIIVHSVAVKEDLCNHLAVEPERITVIPLAADSRFRPAWSMQQLKRIQHRYGLPEAPYILSVCRLERRKNLETLVAVFAALCQRPEGKNIHLVLVGQAGQGASQLLHCIRDYPQLRDKLHHIRRVHEDDLPYLYTHAEMFAYPSLVEGFGLPPLEAMQCGTPVIVSDAPALAEVVSTGGKVVPALEKEAWLEAMANWLKNPDQRESAAALARKQATCFSWQASVDQLVTCYNAILDCKTI